MRRLGLGVVLLVLGAGCAPMKPAGSSDQTAAEAPAAAADAASTTPEWLEVLGVTVEPAGAGRRVVLALNRVPESVEDKKMASPPRVVIELGGPRPSGPTPVTPFPLSDDLVSQVRVGQAGTHLRAVIDLAPKAPEAYHVRQDGATIIAEIGDASGASQAAGAAATANAAPAEPESSELGVRDVQVAPAGDGRRLVITLTRTPDAVKDFTLPDPPRVVMDLRGPLPATPVQTKFPVSDDVVTRVRVATSNGALRVVADLRAEPGAHRVQQDGPRLIVDLGDTSTAAVPAAPAAPAATAADAPKPEPVEVPHAEHVDVPHDEPVASAPPARAPAPARSASGLTTEHATAERVALLTPTSATPDTVYKGQRISLDFKDADVHNVLRVLADVSNLNIIATDDVKGKLTLHLNDVPWDQALDLVLRANRLEAVREGNVVRISTVGRLKEEREALRAAQEAEKELEPLRVKYIRVNYARADEALIEKAKGVLTDRGSVTFDDRTNTIIVRDIPRGIDDATALIHELDVQSPQVLIEANIVEATQDFARALGIQWGYQHQQGPATGNPTGLNFPGTVGFGGSGLGVGTPPPSAAAGVVPAPVPFLADFPVPSSFGSGFGAGTGSALDLALGSLDGANTLTSRLTALEEAGKGKVISRPRVITMNNVAATIQSLTILRVKLPSTGTVINTGTGGAAGSASTATEKINTGITLVVTPQISGDGFVLMNIFAKSSQPDFTHQVDGIPNEVSREANSNVLIKNGETVVLGGIFRNTSQDNESGLPWLRSIPALGWLFKRMLHSNHHEELLVFITPKIASTGTVALPPAERLWEERRRGG